jgi:hypothetical protein
MWKIVETVTQLFKKEKLKEKLKEKTDNERLIPILKKTVADLRAAASTLTLTHSSPTAWPSSENTIDAIANHNWKSLGGFPSMSALAELYRKEEEKLGDLQILSKVSNEIGIIENKKDLWDQLLEVAEEPKEEPKND